MIDSITQRPLEIDVDGFFGPCIVVPEDQLPKVTALLDANKISYWIDEELLSMDEKPYVGFINLGKQVDLGTIQGILDNIP